MKITFSEKKSSSSSNDERFVGARARSQSLKFDRKFSSKFFFPSKLLLAQNRKMDRVRLRHNCSALTKRYVMRAARKKLGQNNNNRLLE
jgi:hypothetical protein